MAEAWQDPYVSYDLFGDGGSAWWDAGAGSVPFDFSGFNFDSNLDLGGYTDYSIPQFTFDPGQYDLGFDPSFNIGQYAPDFQFSDPFALPTGDLSLPTLSLGGGQPFDLSQSYAQNFDFGGGDFNPSLMAGLTPSSVFPQLLNDMGPNPLTEPLSEQFPNLQTPDFSQIFGSNVGAYTGAFDSGLSTGLAPGEGLDTGEGFGGGTRTGTSDLQDAQASYYKYAPLLGLGQLGLSLGGGLMGAFGPQPKPRGPSDIERAQIQANIDAIKAKVELDKQALAQQAELARMQAEAAGGGNETQLEAARMQSETARFNAELQAKTAMDVAALNKRVPLFGTDPRFSTLYDTTNAGQQGLSPDSPDIQAMTQQIYSVRQQAAVAQFQEQRDAILERANRLGTNPAAELAQINEAEQQAQQALFVEAQQQALAFAQSRLDPSNELLQAILGTVV